MRRILFLLTILFITNSQAQGVLVKDIQTGSTSSMPSYEFNRVDANGKLIFSALNNSTNTYNTYITDGSESGTKLLKTYENPQYFTYLSSADLVLFRAKDAGSSTYSLRSTDGTSVNTIWASTIGLDPKYITAFNNAVAYQSLFSSASGYELKYTTPPFSPLNTVSVDLNTAGSSYPEEFKVINNMLFLSAVTAGGREPFINNGTTSSTTRLKDINAGTGSSNPKNFTLFNNKIYFSADDGVNGRELWVTDGTAANTVMVADLNPGANASLNPNEPTTFTVYNDELYFTAYTPTTGNELFKVNIKGNIVNVTDINPGAGGHSNPKGFFVFDDKLFYSADNGTNGVELWYTETGGSISSKIAASTTAMFKDINTQSGGNSEPTDFILFDNKMYFTADDGINGKELWESDGTITGTILKQDINPSGDGNPRDYILSNNLLYFSADDGINGDELWKYSNALIIGSLSPKDNSEDIVISGEKLKIAFNKEVQKGTGNITIYKSSDDSVFEIINVLNTNITISGKEVIVNPTSDFSASEDYYIFIDNGALKDGSNISFVGISNKTVWNFKTAGVQNQTITFNAISNKTFGDADFQLTATASSGLGVSYTSSNTNVASINGNIVTIIGTGTTIITASQIGNVNYNAASDVTQTLTVNKANQTITFNSLTNKAYGNADFQLTAVASSNLPVTYNSSNTSVATINGNTVTIVGVGTTSITASQSGDNNHNVASTVSQNLIVNKGVRVVTIDPIPIKTFGDPNFFITTSVVGGVTATNNIFYYLNSTNAATLSVNTGEVSIIGVGTVSFSIEYRANANYVRTDANGTFTINKADQTITFNSIADVDVNDADFNLAATSDSGLPISYVSSNPSVASINGNVVDILAVGTTTITASQVGNNNYNAANDATQTLTVTNTASVYEFKKLGLLLYPNPIQNKFKIKTQSQIQITKIQVYNVIGKKVKEYLKSQKEYSIQELPEGIYILQIYTEKGVGTTKFIKLK